MFCSLVSVTSNSRQIAFKASSHFQTVSGQMTNAITEESFDSHGIFIDHNTAFWYLLLEGEPSPEYQWSLTDRQIEWEYHQGSIHISCFSIAAYSPVVFNSDSRYSFSAVFLYFGLVSLRVLSSLTSPYATNLLCVITIRQRQAESVGSIKTSFSQFFFKKDQTHKAMIKRRLFSLVCDFCLRYNSGVPLMTVCNSTLKRRALFPSSQPAAWHRVCDQCN